MYWIQMISIFAMNTIPSMRIPKAFDPKLKITFPGFFTQRATI